MEIRAAVLHEGNSPLRVETVTLDPPRAGEVLVRVAAAGVCHSDVRRADGDRVLRARVDGVGRAAATREGELRRVAVDGDDPPGAGHPRRGDDLLADPAAPDHAHAVAQRDPRGVADRAEPGDDGAAEERRLPQRQLGRDGNGARGRHHAALGKT